MTTLSIQHGDIVMLENGDTVKISLEVIRKKVTELVVGKIYKLEYTGQFCHIKGGSSTTEEAVKKGEWQFIGTIPLDGVATDTRYIFYNKSGAYSMWGTRSLDFVVREV